MSILWKSVGPETTWKPTFFRTSSLGWVNDDRSHQKSDIPRHPKHLYWNHNQVDNQEESCIIRVRKPSFNSSIVMCNKNLLMQDTHNEKLAALKVLSHRRFPTRNKQRRHLNFLITCPWNHYQDSRDITKNIPIVKCWFSTSSEYKATPATLEMSDSAVYCIRTSPSPPRWFPSKLINKRRKKR